MYAKQAYIAGNGGISSAERGAHPFTADSYEWTQSVVTLPVDDQAYVQIWISWGLSFDMIPATLS